MKTDQPYKAVIYCRVSDPRQKTLGHGLESQETRLRDYADRLGYQVVRVFADDMSGEYMDRPAMREMLAFLRKQRTPQIVLIDHINRLSRNLKNHLALRDAIRDAGGILEAPDMKFGDDPEEELAENISASVAHHQRRANAKQTKMRMRSRVMNGYYCFAPPLGYRYKDIEPHGKMLVRDEPAASLVQEAYEGYASGYFQSFAEIKRFMQASSALPQERRNRLTNQRIIDLMTRPVYAGRITVSEWDLVNIPAKHEPLISFETFMRVQQRMKGAPLAPIRETRIADFPLRQFVLALRVETHLPGAGRKAEINPIPITCVKPRAVRTTGSLCAAM